MSDQKPLRQEDYMAMAETLRRVQAENEAFKRKLARKPLPWRRIAAAAGVVVGVGVVIAGTTMVIKACAVAEAKQQKHPCYFVRQHLFKDGGEPWEKWHVYQSNCDGGGNYRVYLDRLAEATFETKQAAWEFIQQWHLEACR